MNCWNDIVQYCNRCGADDLNLLKFCVGAHEAPSQLDETQFLPLKDGLGIVNGLFFDAEISKLDVCIKGSGAFQRFAVFCGAPIFVDYRPYEFLTTSVSDLKDATISEWLSQKYCRKWFANDASRDIILNTIRGFVQFFEDWRLRFEDVSAYLGEITMAVGYEGKLVGYSASYLPFDIDISDSSYELLLEDIVRVATINGRPLDFLLKHTAAMCLGTETVE